MTRVAVLILLGATLTLPAAAQRQKPTYLPHEVAVLRALDKVTARVSLFEVKVGEQVRFGTLGIRIRACEKTPPEAEPDAVAFLEVWERRPADTESRWVFTGWMFASSPAVSAMDHPVYDVWLIDCQRPAKASSSDPE